MNFKFHSVILNRHNIGPLRYFHIKPQAIIIAAAARIPWGQYQGQLASANALQLGQVAAEAAVKQSAVPVEQIHRIFMNEMHESKNDNGKEFVFSKFVNKASYRSTWLDDGEPKMETFLNALEFLKTQQQSVVVVGGFESATENKSLKMKKIGVIKSSIYGFRERPSEVIENYMSKSAAKYIKSQMDGEFDAEIVPLTVPKREGNRRSMRQITEDEIVPHKVNDGCRLLQFCDAAASLVLTTLGNAQELKLSPLAVLKDFHYLRNTSDVLFSSYECVGTLFSKVKLNPQQIQHWEIEDYFPEMIDLLKHYFNLNLELINPHGGSAVLGYSPSSSLPRLLTHIAHSLNPLEYGCVVSSSYQESLALIIQKLPLLSIPDCLPLVTVYTKDPCPLCDILIEELESNFSGEYQLEKVFIDSKDNIRFLRLYRFDIPVVFLNNQFICMHRLNRRLLRKRLDLLKP